MLLLFGCCIVHVATTAERGVDATWRGSLLILLLGWDAGGLSVRCPCLSLCMIQLGLAWLDTCPRSLLVLLSGWACWSYALGCLGWPARSLPAYHLPVPGSSQGTCMYSSRRHRFPCQLSIPRRGSSTASFRLLCMSTRGEWRPLQARAENSSLQTYVNVYTQNVYTHRERGRA